MKLISYDGYVFASNGYYGAFEPGTTRGMWSVLPQIRARHNGAGVLTGVQVSERAIPVMFGYAGVDTYETAFLRLLGRLDPLNPEPRLLVAQLNSGAQVQCWAIVTTPGGASTYDEVNLLPVTFLTTSPTWEATSATTSTASFTGGGYSTTVTVANAGQVEVPVRVQVEFNTSTADKHWVYPVSVTNNTALNWYREVVVVDIGDTTSGVAASDTYTTVFYQGVEQARAVMNYGTLRTYVAFPVTLAAGATASFQIVVHQDGSAGAIAATRSLTDPSKFEGDYCAFDLGVATGTATAGAASTLTNSAASWTVDRWAGGFVEILSGTGAGQCRRISSNTATALTVARAWSTNPDATSVYAVHMSGWFVDGGKASAGTTTTLTDSAQAWDANALVGGTISITAGTGSGKAREIESNTADTITVVGGWGAIPDSTSVYEIRRHGYHSYYVDQVNHSASQRGGWQINKRYTAPSRVMFGGDICNGWRRTTYLDNRDDYSQARVTKVNVGGSLNHYFPILNAVRRKGDDKRLQEEGTGDGVAITSALGYQGIRFDYKQRNVSGVGKFIVATREAGGEDWQDVLTDGTTRSTLTTVAAQYLDLSGYGTVNHLYMGVIPDDDVEIPNTAALSDQVEARWNKVLRLYQKAGAVTISKSARAARLRAAGWLTTDSATLGKIKFGATAGADRELFMADKGGTKLVVDSATARAWIDEGGTLTDVPWAVVAIQEKTPQDAAATGERIASRWLWVPPGGGSYTIEGVPEGGTLTFTLTQAYFG